MLTPPNELLLLGDVGLQWLGTVKAAAQDQIKAQLSQCDNADFMACRPCAVYICRRHGIRVGAQHEDAHEIIAEIRRLLVWARPVIGE